MIVSCVVMAMSMFTGRIVVVGMSVVVIVTVICIVMSMSMGVVVGRSMIMVTATVVILFLVELVAICNAGALILLISTRHGALESRGSFDAFFCRCW